MIPGEEYGSHCTKTGVLLKSPWKQRISGYRHETQLSYYGFESFDFFHKEIDPDVKRHHKINDISEARIPGFFDTNIPCSLQEHPFRFVQYNSSLWNEIVRATPRMVLELYSIQCLSPDRYVFQFYGKFSKIVN